MITDQTSFVSKSVRETFLVIQQLRFCATNAKGSGSIPGQGTRSHMLQLRFWMPQLKIRHNQII